jgi:hypothetical protein
VYPVASKNKAAILVALLCVLLFEEGEGVRVRKMEADSIGVERGGKKKEGEF